MHPFKMIRRMKGAVKIEYLSQYGQHPDKYNQPPNGDMNKAFESLGVYVPEMIDVEITGGGQPVVDGVILDMKGGKRNVIMIVQKKLGNDRVLNFNTPKLNDPREVDQDKKSSKFMLPDGVMEAIEDLEEAAKDYLDNYRPDQETLFAEPKDLEEYDPNEGNTAEEKLEVEEAA